MAILLKNALVDGQTHWELGVDTNRSPVRVPRNQLCLSVNNTTRQDLIGPRSQWRQIPLAYLTAPPVTVDNAMKNAFETGLFQKFSGYVPDTGPSHLVFAVAGQLYRVEPFNDGRVTQIPMQGTTPFPTPWPTKRPNVWFCQAEQFLVAQDGKSTPLIYDGATLRESDVLGTSGEDADGHPLVEVPPGSVMAYSEGRLWVALEDGLSFAAGDAVRDPTGTAFYQRRDAVLKFTSNTYLNEGGAFAIPAQCGRITAMVVMPQIDTSLGQGPLVVFCAGGAFSVAAPFDRATWKSVTYPIKSVALTEHGFLSDAGVVTVNSDAWGRSLDGYRSHMVARRDFVSGWGNRAMSARVVRHLRDDDPHLLFKQSAALFDNRLLGTCAPMREPATGRVFHRGLIVLDFFPVTTVPNDSEPGQPPPNPVWDGLWTRVGDGGDVLQVLTVKSENVDHCYAAVLAQPSEDGLRRLQLWELQYTDGPDTGVGSEPNAPLEVRTQRVFEMPAIDFAAGGSNAAEQNLLEAFDGWYTDAEGVVDFDLYWRPDQHPCWLHWKHWQVCAPTGVCPEDAVDGCAENAMNRQPMAFPRLSALKPPSMTLPGEVPAEMGYTFQFRLEVTGHATILAMRFLALRVVEASFGAPGPDAAACSETINCCPPQDANPGPLAANTDSPNF